MTEDMMTFRTLIEKTPDADILREMIGFAAERLIAGGASSRPSSPRPLHKTTPWRRASNGARLPINCALMDDERLNGEIKRRTEEYLPNEAAITRLVGAILLEQNDEWAVQRAAT